METRIPPTLQFGVITPEDAVRVFRQRNLLSPTYNWQELWQDAHARAFTVSRLARLDLLAAVRNAVDDAIDNGASLREFQARLRPLLADAGWWGTREVIDPRTGEVLRTTFGPTRLQLIYETNLRQSFAAGRWQRVQRNKSVLHYLRYRTARDERVRPAHAAWEGVTLPVDHPWWQTHYPPCGWRCRCRAYAVSAAAIDRARARGERVITTAPADGSYQVRNTATGEVLTVPAGVDPGFGYNAGIAAGAALQDARAAALARAPADLAAAHVAAEDRLAQAWIARYARDAVRSGQVERWREQAARYGFAADALTDAEQRMLVAYTQSGAGSLNQYARGDWPVNSVEIVQGFEAAAATLDRALAKMPATDAAVISRLDLPPAVLLRLQPGAVWTRPDYTSASYAPTVAGEAELYKERPVRLLIQGRSGRVIDWGSPSQFEREVLFPRGTRFVVVAREEVGAETHITLREVQ